jgi:hypothetical protein
MPKKKTSFRLSEEGLGYIRELSATLGISQADVVEMAVRGLLWDVVIDKADRAGGPQTAAVVVEPIQGERVKEEK